MVTDRWPAISYETLPWTNRYERGMASRRQLARHHGPYRAAVVPGIQDARLDLPSEVLAEAEDASNEISRFDAEMGDEIMPFGAVLLRSESAASSQIEHLTASARAIAEAEIGTGTRRNAMEIVANTRAMEAAITLADRLDGEAILAMHRALLDATDRKIAGKWRTQQVWIGGSNIGPHEAAFVPPGHERVPEAIDDLVAFIRRDDLPVLVQSAIAHAQFETIHPFPDGNGRTGRALMHAMLRNKSLTRSVAVPVSSGLLTDTEAYFDALGTYRSGDPAAIVRQVARAAFAAIGNGRELVTQLRDIRADWRTRVSARRDSKVWRVVDLLMEHPVVNATLVAAELHVPGSNAYRYIGPLVAAGVVTEFTDRKRGRAWGAAQVLAALDAFAARSERRRLPA